MLFSRMPRLTPQTLGDILESEPKATVIYDDAMHATGVELPLPEGMTHSDGSRVKTAMFGDRVGKDDYGHWIVVPAG